MSGQFLHTIGALEQIPKLFKGTFLYGRSEPRIAIVGRSNVGKSSLINSLLNQRLAQVSVEPGKTRKIHLYLWKEARKIIADLPGYGFAKSSHVDRNEWAKLIEGYLTEDEGLEQALVLLDARHGPTDLDAEALSFLRGIRVGITLVFTKADAIKTQKERAARKKEASAALSELGWDPTTAYWVSSRTQDLGWSKLEADLRKEAGA